MRVVSYLFVFCCLVGDSSLQAQGTRADYERADRLAREARGKVLNLKLELHWFADGTCVWFREDLPEGECQYILVQTEPAKRDLAFDHARLAAALSKVTGETVGPRRMRFVSLDLAKDLRSISFQLGKKRWECNLDTYELQGGQQIARQKVSGLQPLDKPMASRNGGMGTSVTFDNETQQSVRIFWNDVGGTKQSFGKLAAGEHKVQHTFAGHVWLVEDEQGALLGAYEATDDAGLIVIRAKPQPQQPNPATDDEVQNDDANEKPLPQLRPGIRTTADQRASVHDDNVYWREKPDATERQLTTDGTPENSYGGPIRWSPNGRYFVAMRTQPAEKHPVFMVESSPKGQVQPKLHEQNYLKPGDRIEVSKPALFEAATGKQIELEDALYANPWKIDRLRWDADSSRFTFLFNQRGHQALRIIAVEVSGKTKAIVNEESKTFIDYSNKFFLDHLLQTNEIVWMSERDGWNHLYLYDAKTGEVKNQITRGNWVVHSLKRIDVEKRQITFFARGLDPEQDPYYLHHCRIDFDGKNLTRLTEGDGAHWIEYSPDKKFMHDTYSRVDQPPVHELRRMSDGKLVVELLRTDLSRLAKTGWRAPERFTAKGRDGKTDIYGIICRPSNFDPNKKYPVIERIYAGPHAAFVPKLFSEWQGNLQTYAELGFIVVQIDGMGTSHRSKAFHDVCWQNLADAGFPDRIKWLKAAAKHEPAMDLERVGIFGGSAGGQNALGALLLHGDFYKAAVADCGCHDNRMDKIWWNEQWMGYPIGKHYEEQSNVTLAKNLKGKLLLTVGELDKNVDPASTMQVVNALIKADKDFDLLIVPGAGHGIGESPYADRRRRDFFVRHLLGVEPRN